MSTNPIVCQVRKMSAIAELRRRALLLVWTGEAWNVMEALVALSDRSSPPSQHFLPITLALYTQYRTAKDTKDIRTKSSEDTMLGAI